MPSNYQGSALGANTLPPAEDAPALSVPTVPHRRLPAAVMSGEHLPRQGEGWSLCQGQLDFNSSRCPAARK